MTFSVRGEEEVTGSSMRRSLNVFKDTKPSVSCFALITFSKKNIFMFETNRFGTHNRSDF